MDKDPSTLISSYKRRQQVGPFIVGAIAVVLVIIGVIILILWFTGPNGPKITLFATETPTPTMTFTPTVTVPPTDTPTETPTPSDTPTPTPGSPFYYTVQDGDSLATIVSKFNLGDKGIPLILILNPYDAKAGTGIDPSTQIIFVGEKILIPNPDMPLPTDTPVPNNLPFGTKITYTIKAGDSLASIASKFNSTTDDIVKQNNITDPNKIGIGEQLIIRANIVTPTPTRAPTITPGPSVTPPSPLTATFTPGGPVSPTATSTTTATP